ncbi:tyrosine-type recombinase/integrase [Singulisphaera sp. PoT]|uniref:tyrosine-type recombinase/integrase n=1 Tax=Singulisphaera sp. PoT TaxID=3411797 RepID=UPI003BF4F388
MPRKPTVPSYRLHKPSGQAVVTLSGKDHYLGVHGSEKSLLEYDRLVTLWTLAGRKLCDRPSDLTVSEMIVRFVEGYAERWYRKNGRYTSSMSRIRAVSRSLNRLYGNHPAREFRPSDLKTMRAYWEQAGHARGTVNDAVFWVRKMFAWAAEEELIPGSVLADLKAVKNLAKGRTTAPDYDSVTPVPEDLLEATLAHLRPMVAALVRLQLATGMRPGEACMMRPCDIDRSGEVWRYIPREHKTEHKGKERVVLLGPEARAILGPLLESTRERSAIFTKARRPKDQIDVTLYGREIDAACAKARPHPTLGSIRPKDRTAEQANEYKRWMMENGWNPNQLRHNAATRLRKQFGIETARIILGHSSAFTTEIYAEADVEKAMLAIGQAG